MMIVICQHVACCVDIGGVAVRRVVYFIELCLFRVEVFITFLILVSFYLPLFGN